jgi:hypothetical protein
LIDSIEMTMLFIGDDKRWYLRQAFTRVRGKPQRIVASAGSPPH